MTGRNLLKLTIFFTCLLFLQQNVNAQQRQDNIMQTAPVPKPAVQTSSDTNNNDGTSGDQMDNYDQNQASQQPTQTQNYQDNTQTNNQQSVMPTVKSPADNQLNKDNSETPDETSQNKMPFDFKNFGWNQEKQSNNTYKNDLIDDSINKLIPNNSAHKFHWRDYIPTLLGIIGLMGTFLGIFSTWLIYHLNKKNNNPLVIDKKDAAVKYIEELYKIKDFLITDKIQELYNLLNTLSAEQFSQAQLGELISLLTAYSKLAISISEVPLMEVHDRYKKHIKGKNYEIFRSLTSSYKMIYTEGIFYSDNINLINSHNFQANIFCSEENLKKWKSKAIIVLALDEKINKTLNLLNKDLR